MKKLLYTATFLAFGSAASGADLEMPARAPVPMPVASDWTGFYFGINGGWGRSSPTSEPGLSITGVTVTPIFQSPHLSGWVVGGHAGYNWQYGLAVGGLEIDADVADVNQTQTASLAPFGVPVAASLNVKIDDLGSARAKLGIVPFQWGMFYATGGLGWAHSSIKASFSVTGVGTASDEADQNSVGWVLGGGAEFAFAQHFLLRAEYLHYDFGTQTISFPNGAAFLSVGVLPDSNAKITVDVVRGGLSYRF